VLIPLSRRKGPNKTLDANTTRVISRSGPYFHLNHAGVHDAILQVEANHYSSSSSPNPAAPSVHSRAPKKQQQKQRQKDVVVIPEEEEEMVPIMPSSSDYYEDASQPRYYTEADNFIGHFRNWLPFRLVVRSRAGASKKQSLMGALGELLVATRQGGQGMPATTTTRGRLSTEEEWMLDAARLVWAAEGTPKPSVSLGRLDDEMRHLPMPLTRLNKELVRTHLKLLSRFKSSVGGSPAPDNPFMKHWIPFMLQDPLLIQTLLFTSACFLNETGHLPKTVVVALRGLVYQALNHNLRSKRLQNQINDAAIMGVAEMVLLEWYWGATTELYAHLKGLKTMIRLRGGMSDLGMHGYLAKLVLM
jgi:Fungal specific transcription factor domain